MNYPVKNEEYTEIVDGVKTTFEVKRIIDGSRDYPSLDTLEWCLFQTGDDKFIGYVSDEATTYLSFMTDDSEDSFQVWLSEVSSL